MTPLFRKLNLGERSVIHVLNAPASFEPALAELEGVAVKRSVSGRAGFETVRMVAIDEDWCALRFRRVEYIKPRIPGTAGAKVATVTARRAPGN